MRASATWFWDQEIFDFIGDRPHLLGQPSLRAYCLAWELKSAGLDWQAGVLGRRLKGAALAVAKLRADGKYQTEEEQVRAFVSGGFNCRVTYFTYARRQQSACPAPRVRLSNTKPPGPPAPPLDLTRLLQERFKQAGQG